LGCFDLKEWNNNENWAFVPKNQKSLFMKIKRIKTKLGDDYNCNQYSNCFRKKHKSILIFEEKPEDIPFEFLRKYQKMGEIKEFTVDSDFQKYVIVIHNNDLAWSVPNLKHYFKENNISKNDLFEIKRDSEKNIDKYDELIYIGYRIPRLHYKFVLVNDKTWVDNTYFITKKKSTAFSLKYLIAILNSDLMRYYIDITGKKKEHEIEIGAMYLRNLPIILRRGSLDKAKLNLISEIGNIVSKIIKLEKQNKNIEAQIKNLNEMVYLLYDISENDKELIKDYLTDTSLKFKI